MPTSDEHQALSRRRDELRQELAHVADLRQGSLSSRYRDDLPPTNIGGAVLNVLGLYAANGRI